MNQNTNRCSEGYLSAALPRTLYIRIHTGRKAEGGENCVLAEQLPTKGTRSDQRGTRVDLVHYLSSNAANLAPEELALGHDG